MPHGPYCTLCGVAFFGGCRPWPWGEACTRLLSNDPAAAAACLGEADPPRDGFREAVAVAVGSDGAGHFANPVGGLDAPRDGPSGATETASDDVAVSI